MSDIPEHIMEEAAALRRAVVWQSNEAVEHIARALAAAEQRGAEKERERCAKVAEKFRDRNPFPTVYEAIAAAIRRGEP